MPRTAKTIVAEIKTLFVRRHEEKLTIQADMAILRDVHGWTQQEITEATGVPQRTVSDWLQAYDEGLSDPAKASRLTPVSVQAASDARVAKRVLATAPLEHVEHWISELPKERRQEIAAAVGHAHSKARVEFEERERNLTPVQRKEREANHATIDSFGAAMTSPFIVQRILDRLEQVDEDVRELIAHDQLTPEIARKIGSALEKLNNEFEVAKAMSGLDEEEL